MAAVKRDGTSIAQGYPWNYRFQWRETPRWHWRRWARGQMMRRLVMCYTEDEWEYATYEECARIVLEETYGHSA